MHTVTLLQAFILGLIQGIAEFFPISSSAHLKFARFLMGIPDGANWLYFDLACHAGTWFALAYFLRKEILKVLLSPRQITLFSLALAPLVPAYFLLKPLRIALSAPIFTGYFLLITALLLFLASYQRRITHIPNVTQNAIFARRESPAVERSQLAPYFLILSELRSLNRGTLTIRKNRVLSHIGYTHKWINVLFIGVMQALALIPGISRSGSTIAAARFCGWSWIDGARFSFLLAIPTILGGEVLESIKLFRGESDPVDLMPCIIGLITSFAFGLIAVRFVFWFYERNIVKPFAWYCLGIGLLMIWTYPA